MTTRQPMPMWPLVVGAVATVLLMVWLSRMAGTAPIRDGTMSMLLVMLVALPLTAGWLASAYGWGRLVGRGLRLGETLGVIGDLGLGIAVKLILLAIIAPLGGFQAGSAAGVPIGGWLLIVVGISAAVILRPKDDGGRMIREYTVRTGGVWWWLAASPALAVLFTAACSAPGWLWATEFGGYDALSYHLQLPREWLALGAATPLEHNVYSFLPSYMEHAYYHLAVLRGDGVEFAYAAQWLHAAVTVLAAATVARTLSREVTPAAGVVGFGLMLGTPWTVVVGSLAYNEMVMVLMFALAVDVVWRGGTVMNDAMARDRQDVDQTRAVGEADDERSAGLLRPWQRGAVVGLVCAAACGAKLTAAGFVVLPVTMLVLGLLPRRVWLVTLGVAALAGACGLLPWLARNWLATGNPVFPFATGLFGTGHWSAEQAATWSAGHMSALGAGARAIELWDQFIRFGFGAAPSEEPWRAQWSVLVPLAVGAGLALVAIDRKRRKLAINLLGLLAIQVIFWMAFTHLKSRFLLATIVPMTICIGLFAGWWQRLRQDREGFSPPGSKGGGSAQVLWLAVVVALGWCAQPVWHFSRERGSAPALQLGLADVMSGAGLSVAERGMVASDQFPAVYVNYMLNAEDRILLIGDAAPFYMRPERITYQTTWDRGPMSDILRGDLEVRWSEVLLQEGFTHVLINFEMLRIWERSGWNDPLLSEKRMRELVDAHGGERLRYGEHVVLLRLRE